MLGALHLIVLNEMSVLRGSEKKKWERRKEKEEVEGVDRDLD